MDTVATDSDSWWDWKTVPPTSLSVSLSPPPPPVRFPPTRNALSLGCSPLLCYRSSLCRPYCLVKAVSRPMHVVSKPPLELKEPTRWALDSPSN